MQGSVSGSVTAAVPWLVAAQDRLLFVPICSLPLVQCSALVKGVGGRLQGAVLAGGGEHINLFFAWRSVSQVFNCSNSLLQESCRRMRAHLLSKDSSSL